MNLERPIMFAALREIEQRLGNERFPLISQTYWSNPKQMVITEFPFVAKVSHAHAGMGKMKVDKDNQFSDLRTVLSLHGDYCTGEPYIEAEYGLRVQKVGKTYRVMKKIFTGSGWKSQFGGASLVEIELTPQYKLWADECSKAFGGLDILALDVLHGIDGKDYIIELNDTAIGFLANRWEEDTLAIRDCALERLLEIFCSDKDKSSNCNSESSLLKQEQERGAGDHPIQRRYEIIQQQKPAPRGKNRLDDENQILDWRVSAALGLVSGLALAALAFLFSRSSH